MSLAQEYTLHFSYSTDRTPLTIIMTVNWWRRKAGDTRRPPVLCRKRSGREIIDKYHNLTLFSGFRKPCRWEIKTQKNLRKCLHHRDILVGLVPFVVWQYIRVVPISRFVRIWIKSWRRPMRNWNSREYDIPKITKKYSSRHLIPNSGLFPPVPLTPWVSQTDGREER